MSYTFRGIISDATMVEYSILKVKERAKELHEPIRLIFIEPDTMHFKDVEKFAHKVSTKLVGRTVVAIEYITWAGTLDCFNGTLYRNGRKDELHKYENVEGDEEPFFKLLLELGVVLPEEGYFAPFDRGLNDHVGG